MSSAALDNDLIGRPGPWAVPYEYELGATETVRPATAYATWDGTGASGDFLPCLAFYSQDGTRVARVFPSTKVAAGDVANVTYAPFPGGLIAGNGIRYEVDNEGDWLDVTVNGGDASGRAVYLKNTTADTVRVESFLGDLLAFFREITFEVGGGSAGLYVNHDTIRAGLFTTKGSLIIDGTNGAVLSTGGVQPSLQLGASGDATLRGDNIEIGTDFAGDILVDGVNISVFVSGGNMTINLLAGKKLVVTDHLGNPIFEVHENGDLFGKTGKTLSFTL